MCRTWCTGTWRCQKIHRFVKNSHRECTQEGRDLVTADDVYRARDKFEMNILKESIKTLPIHSKMVLLSAALTQETDSDLTVTGEIYENYKTLAPSLVFNH